MGGVLIDHKELALILNQPVGLEDLSDNPKARLVLRDQDLGRVIFGKVRVLKQAGLLERALDGGSRSRRVRLLLCARRCLNPLIFEEKVLEGDPGGTGGMRRCSSGLHKMNAGTGRVEIL